MFRSKFSVELRNRFEVLEVEENINEDCIQGEKVYTETGEKVLGRIKKEKQAVVERGHQSNRTAAKKKIITKCTPQNQRGQKPSLTTRVHAERQRG